LAQQRDRIAALKQEVGFAKGRSHREAATTCESPMFSNYMAFVETDASEQFDQVMSEQTSQKLDGGDAKRRRALTEQKDATGGFGIRLSEADGETNLTLPRIMVDGLSRSKQLDAGDRIISVNSINVERMPLWKVVAMLAGLQTIELEVESGHVVPDATLQNDLLSSPKASNGDASAGDASHLRKMSLTQGACRRLSRGDTDFRPTVQVIDVKEIASDLLFLSNRYRLIISDGEHYMQAMLASQLNDLVEGSQIAAHCVMKLDEFLWHEIQGTKIVILLAVEVVQEPAGSMIGNPQNVEEASTDEAARTHKGEGGEQAGGGVNDGGRRGAAAPVAAPSTKEEWLKLGESVDGIDESFPGWRDQIEDVRGMDEEGLQRGLEGMQTAVAESDGFETAGWKKSLSFFVDYTKFCLAQAAVAVAAKADEATKRRPRRAAPAPAVTSLASLGCSSYWTTPNSLVCCHKLSEFKTHADGFECDGSCGRKNIAEGTTLHGCRYTLYTLYSLYTALAIHCTLHSLYTVHTMDAGTATSISARIATVQGRMIHHPNCTNRSRRRVPIRPPAAGSCCMHRLRQSRA
jgi:hypothetical protein